MGWDSVHHCGMGLSASLWDGTQCITVGWDSVHHCGMGLSGDVVKILHVHVRGEHKTWEQGTSLKCEHFVQSLECPRFPVLTVSFVHW